MIDGREAIRKLALTAVRLSGVAPLARPFTSGIGAILMLHRVTASPEKPNGVNRHLNIAPSFLDALIGEQHRCDAPRPAASEIQDANALQRSNFAFHVHSLARLIVNGRNLRAGGSVEASYQTSPKGRSSTRKDQVERS